MTLGRWLWGLACAAATAAALVFTQASSDPVAAISISLLLIFTASVALQQLSPLVVPLVARLAGVLARRSVEGEIAHANLVDGRRRAATTAGPLITLVGIVVGLYGVVLTQSAAEVRDLELTTRAQLVVITRGVDTTQIAAVHGVTAAVPLAEVRGRVLFRNRGKRRAVRVDLVATDPVTYRAVMRPRLRAGRLGAFAGGTLIANGDADGPFPSDPAVLHVTTGDRTATLRVAARTATSLADFTAATIPLGQVDPALLARARTRVMVTVEPGTDIEAARRRLIEAGYADTRTTSDWAAGDTATTANLNRTVVLGLAGLGSLYALFAVINAVALACAARSREFAVAQVTGLTRRQVIRTSVLESLGVAVIGVALGTAAAATCLAAVRRAFNLLLGEPVLVVPWWTLVAPAAASLAAVATTAAAGTWLATRHQPIRLAAARE